MPPDDHDRPLLSVVAASRNDDHGGALLARMQVFLDALAAQVARHGLRCELVLVEWNPPADRAPLSEALRWPHAEGWSARIVRVPREVHDEIAAGVQLPLFQMIAKNVGIRRCSGHFVLATNIDVLLSSALVRFIGAELRTGRMYRVDRYDVDRGVPVDATLDEQLVYCERHVIRVCRRERTLDLRDGSVHLVQPPLRLLGWASYLLQDLGLRRVRTPTHLHTNACGDFTLMHRDHWHALRGYAELRTYSMHLDSLLCHAAHHAGFREHVVPDPARVYHIEHDVGSGFTPEGEAAMDRRLQRLGVDKVSGAQLHEWTLQMRRQRSAIELNEPDWGLATMRFEEHAP